MMIIAVCARLFFLFLLSLPSSLIALADCDADAVGGVNEDANDRRRSAQSSSQQPQQQRPPPPNIVLLFVDDLGYGDMGFTGHPTTHTPNLDKLAKNGKILTTWYSGCAVCTGSRAALMTGRQFLRTGVPGVFGPTVRDGLPLNETTLAEHLSSHYTTAAVGKWHLGQRKVYLPQNRGFSQYLGIPYSDDMGKGRLSSCPSGSYDLSRGNRIGTEGGNDDDNPWNRNQYKNMGFLGEKEGNGQLQQKDQEYDPAGDWLPLVYQVNGSTHILEQPLDFTTLSHKYSQFVRNFITQQRSPGQPEQQRDHLEDKKPFFLYVPFSHVHVTRNTPDVQYAGCEFRNITKRGPFGDALAELDAMVRTVVETLEETQQSNNTLILFTSDNGPWLVKGLSAGSAGLFTGRFSEYWDTGKGTTWEGGIRMPAFAYWPGHIEPGSRSSEVVSSLDVFPTLSSIAGIPLPAHLELDGKDMSDVLFNRNGGKSKHDFLFFYGTCAKQNGRRPDDRNMGQKGWGIAAVRHGRYKAHWCTAPGLSGIGVRRTYYDKYPLLFDIEQDPSESIPISNGTMPTGPEHSAAMKRIMKAYAFEVATFQYGTIVPEPDGPGERHGQYGLCCDRAANCNCDSDGAASTAGLFNVGTKRHHDTYHYVLGEQEPLPPRTKAQKAMLLK